MTLARRRLRVKFDLGQGDFGTAGTTSLTLDNLQVSAQIQIAGGVSMGSGSVAIWGMTLDHMNKLSTIGTQYLPIRRNTLTIYAGEADDQDNFINSSLVYQGSIANAWLDGRQAPNVSFRVECKVGMFESALKAAPQSHSGGVDAATAMQGLAKQMGFAFENNGVTVKLNDSYFWGSARNQLMSIAQHAGIQVLIDKGTVSIWNTTQGRNGDVVQVNENTGMDGFPSFSSLGIYVRTIFNPTIEFGKKIQVTSKVTSANGLWFVYRLDHNLEARIKNGAWFSDVSGIPQGAPTSAMSSAGVSGS